MAARPTCGMKCITLHVLPDFSSSLPQRENSIDYDTSNPQPLIRYNLLCRRVQMNRMVLSRDPVEIFLSSLSYRNISLIVRSELKNGKFQSLDQPRN